MQQIVHPTHTLIGLGRALITSFKRPGQVRALPARTWVLPQVALDATHIARYAQVCGFDAGADVPLTYPQLLTFPLVMAFMTSADCPWPAIGTVHLANAITAHAPIQAGDLVRVEMETGSLLSHDKGQVFQLHLRLFRAAQTDGPCLWQATQTLLRLGVSTPVGPSFPADWGDDLSLRPCTTLEVQADTGRRYASVSGDYNPIHLWPLTAQWLGFQKAIAHGLWTQARALAALPIDQVTHGYTLQTHFKRPLYLPATATLWHASAPPIRQFEVRDATGEVLHLRSQLTPLPHSETIQP